MGRGARIGDRCTGGRAVKRIFNVIALTLAMNFLLVLGGAAFVLKSSHMDREKFAKVKDLLFATSEPTTEPASTEPVATTEPAERLDELLAKASGRPAGEQIDFIRQTFESKMAELDRRQRELQDLQHQIDLSRDQTTLDRTKIEQGEKALATEKEQQTKLASDKGFQNSLELYNVMPAKQVKTIFMTLSDETVVQYLQAMEPRAAGKIIKEFKAPEETARIQKVLEMIRLAQPLAVPDAAAVSPTAAAAP